MIEQPALELPSNVELDVNLLQDPEPAKIEKKDDPLPIIFGIGVVLTAIFCLDRG
jgi:hypothetical protein